ncbi:DsbA family protein [Vibrio rumoiensis]|uniref:DsbA family protein n=1 Tax=Vibrio rumoiensis TaxID=76258 RepID=UPI003AA91D59
MTNIHYFYDPMCGWCYGATPLIQAIEENPNLNLIVHPGGMIEKGVIPEHFKRHILNADPRIAELTGAKFGDAYVQRLKGDQEFILDSFLPIKAILVAETLGERSFNMLKSIQLAHYVKGTEVYKLSELEALISSIGLDASKWLDIMLSEESEHMLTQTLQNSHDFMRKLNISGYPTLIVESNNSFIKLPHEQYYSRQNDWVKYLTSI